VILSAQSRRIGIVVAGLVLVAGACGGSDTPDAGTQPATTTATQATGTTRTPTGVTTPSEVTTTSEPAETTETTTAAGTSAVSSTITADELCELLPTVEIGVVMNAQSEVTTLASPSEDSTICLLSIFIEKTVYMSVELVSNDGEAGFEEEADHVESIFATNAFEIAGVGDRAVGFERLTTHILVLAGQSVVRIIGPDDAPYSPEQAAEIGGLVAAALS